MQERPASEQNPLVEERRELQPDTPPDRDVVSPQLTTTQVVQEGGLRPVVVGIALSLAL